MTTTPAEQLEQSQVMADAKNFGLPLLMLFGDADPVADLVAARIFFDAVATEQKQLQVIPGMLHEMLRETDREMLFEVILQWMRGRSA